MSSARLTALRLVGFKSFAERTLVEFGPGISAVVGPNGSGKSNLADALRWTLGEQGRSLRTRRSEDVIFAGSSSRRAVGMADVTLVIENSDRLLPVDYGEVEIGRRLYRSGENEYLLNRQRIRLRDLVDLLDAGNLADNAFLFIGQGMVDQALALRPEERRPLFEEAAGVRRHERRRRHAEAELAEAETNLERLRDVLGELRPQARRLAAQAEQLQARRTAGVELAEALLAGARTRWEASSEVASREQEEFEIARAAADSALSELHRAEEDGATISLQIGERAEGERSRREIIDRQRAEIVDLRVAQARIESELAATQRDRDRVADQRAAAEERLRSHGQALSLPRPEPDPTIAAELDRVSQLLDEGGTLRTGDADQPQPQPRAELTLQRQRLDELTQAAAEGHARLAKLTDRLATAERERDAAIDQLAAVGEAEKGAQAALEAARSTLDAAAAELNQARDRVAVTEAEAAAARARLGAIEAGLDAGVDEELVRAVRARGAKPIADGLEVDPRLRRAVSAALGRAAEAFAVDEATPAKVAGRRGSLVMRRARLAERPPSALATAAVGGAAELGGGRLVDAIRRDPQGEATRLLARSVWVPDLAAAMKVYPALTPGWQVATLAGEVIGDQGVVWLAGESSVLELRAQYDEQRRSLTDLDERLVQQRAEMEQRSAARAEAASAVRAAQDRAEAARRDRRTAEEAERVGQRRADQLVREVTWEQAHVDRMATEKGTTAAAVGRLEDELRETKEPVDKGTSSQASGSDAGDAVAARAAELGVRRDQMLAERSAEEARFAAWLEARRTAEVSRAMDETRLHELDPEAQRIVGREAGLESERDDLAARLAAAAARERDSTAELDVLLAAGADDRARLAGAERAAVEARERLRTAEAASRRSEVAAMEARLQLEQIREQLLVELAGIGRDGLVSLLRAAGDDTEPADDESLAAGALDVALDAVVLGWSKDKMTDEAAGAGKLAVLRRRFHDLGAGNPFAVEEYAEARERLETLEAQRTDLEIAISSTRELIVSLSTLINDQFRQTFAALEDAFARRFEELFGGGDAQLSLTAPDDLSTTGIEIHARPPGKKRQPLAMLSGGERALTAVSLLLAMLEVRPVPFCVLDEVDAALDEANIARFSNALRGLAEQTQFIVITHNRGTIEAADALYGVTLGDDAVSRVISLRLPDENGSGEGGLELVAQEATART